MLSLGEPTVRDAKIYNGPKLTTIHINQTVTVSVMLNNSDFTNSGQLFIQVKNLDGNTQASAITHVNLQPSENVTLDIIWTPLMKGTYDVQAGFAYDPPLPMNFPMTRLKVEVA